MDPTTQAHFDPTTATLPSLSANQSTAGAYNLGGVPEPSHSNKFGNAFDSTESGSVDYDSAGHPIPQSQNPFLGGGETANAGSTGTTTDSSYSSNIPSSNDVKSQIPSSDELKAKIPSSQEVKNSIPSKEDIKNSETATGIRQRVNTLGNKANENVNAASRNLSATLDQVNHHPIVENAKEGAQQQVGQFREYLGRSPTIVNLEKRLNIDRVFLVAGGALLYILLVPLNLFGMALPTTTLLTLAPPVLLALQILDKDNMQDDGKTKSLLAYFVVLGFIQTLESLAAGVLAKRIPQYYTVKLLFLAYLLHPKTQGALQFHETVLKPAFVQSGASKSSYSSTGASKSSYSSSGTSSIGNNASPTTTTPPQSKSQGGSAQSSPFVGQMPVKGTVDSQGNITSIAPAQGQFEVQATQ